MKILVGMSGGVDSSVAALYKAAHLCGQHFDAGNAVMVPHPDLGEAELVEKIFCPAYLLQLPGSDCFSIGQA